MLSSEHIYQTLDGAYETTSGQYTTLPYSAPDTDYAQYLRNLRQPFIKLCRLRFLNPDGSTAFALDNNEHNPRSKAFITDGIINVNLQNGQRRTANVTIANAGDEYEYAYGKMWFGQEVALDEGMVLPSGEIYYIPQGIFLIDNPSEQIQPNRKTVTYNLVDKWSFIDGSHFGNLEGAYEVDAGTNIFAPIISLLSEDRGNGLPIDRITPVITNYYNSMTQELPDGTTVSITDAPYTLTVESGTIADVILGLCKMVNAWVGYDASGALRIDPSQDDVADADKPVAWEFSQDETTLLGLTYTVKNTEVFNDYIVVGEQLDNYAQPCARAQNYDPKSDTNINIIGRKTKRENASGFGTDQMCMDYAVWKLKRATVLNKAVTIQASQVLHIRENQLVTVQRTDKEGSPTERHLVQGFSRPLVGTGSMTINAISVYDIPDLDIASGNTTS